MKIKFNYGDYIKLTKLERRGGFRGQVTVVYYGMIAIMGCVTDNTSVPDPSLLRPLAIILKNGDFINIGRKYELTLA